MLEGLKYIIFIFPAYFLILVLSIVSFGDDVIF